MNRLVAALLLAALAASNIAWFALYQSEHSRVEALSSECERLDRLLRLLNEEAAKLKESNVNLTLRLQELSSKCRRLAELVKQADMAEKATLIEILAALNQTLTELWLHSLTHVYYTRFVRSLVQPGRVADLVMEVTGTSVFDARRVFEHLRALYNYTAYEIETARDQPVLALTSPRFLEIGGKRYIYSFRLEKVENYIQSAVETVARGAGDCEDKAILLTSLYIEYLGDYGDSWVVCVFGSQGYSHCFTVAYVKPYKRYVVADPTLDYYTVVEKLGLGVDMLFEYIGLRWSDVTKAIAFNNRVFEEGTLSTIINFIEALAG